MCDDAFAALLLARLCQKGIKVEIVDASTYTCCIPRLGRVALKIYNEEQFIVAQINLNSSAE